MDPDPDPNKKLGVWIWIRFYMDIFWILDQDPDPHENLCGSTALTIQIEVVKN